MLHSIKLIDFLVDLVNFGVLKKALHILLLSFYLLSCTELHELTKLPVLFQHYFEHKSLDKDITFLAYLEHHYNDVPHTDNDKERDDQLPFKTHELFASTVISPALPPSFEVIPKKVCQILQKQKILINNDHIPNSAFAGKIWQPPKTVS
ncbi:hypothetical protein [Pedobacter sp. SL55]|uniref:hypothetical protein n=1 Tax=Pedobacter sp. SL55 TaxID=2995161 RepID=UPI00227051D7|nr:hypothetical protein [Pedobacter sp. SL55]WAC39661.1 hypothetical protein OVA16_13865 [Pedobacter sp. SL55]